MCSALAMAFLQQSEPYRKTVRPPYGQGIDRDRGASDRNWLVQELHPQDKLRRTAKDANRREKWLEIGSC